MNSLQRKELERVAAKLLEQADELQRLARALLLAARVKGE